MKRVLFMGGHPRMADNIKALDFKVFSDQSFGAVSAHSITEFFDNQNIPFNKALESLMNNPKVKSRANLLVTFMTGKSYFKSNSFRTRITIILFSQYRTVDFSTLKIVLRHFFRVQTFLSLIAFILGFLRFSPIVFKRILAIGIEESELLEKLLDFVDPDLLIFLDNGNNELFFLLSIMPKRAKMIYVFYVYSWDNASTKCFIPDRFDHVGAWNHDQIDEIIDISRFPKRNIFVAGSLLADKSYSTYNNVRRSSFQCGQGELLLIGMFNKSNEAQYLLKINEILKSGKSPYKSITYRPHPQSRSNLKKAIQFKLEEHGITVDTSKNFNVKKFDGVISLPTSMILEVIVSGIPLVVFAPIENQHRAHPSELFNWSHFEKLKSLNLFTVSSNLKNLERILESGIPAQNKELDVKFQSIFPNFQNSYELRAKEEINRIFSSTYD